jgi:hypothetical protein
MNTSVSTVCLRDVKKGTYHIASGTNALYNSDRICVVQNDRKQWRSLTKDILCCVWYQSREGTIKRIIDRTKVLQVFKWPR